MSALELHKVSIWSPDITGMSTKLYLDGVPVKGLRHINLDIGLNEPTVLKLELLVDGVNVEATAEARVKSTAGFEEHPPTE